MKQFLLSLLFGKTIILTPSPIPIGEEWVELSLAKPLEAVSGGASVQLDVTGLIEKRGLYEARAEAEQKFPKGSVSGQLIARSGEAIQLENVGVAWSSESIKLLLSSEGLVPVDVEFVWLRLKSTNQISSAIVYWQNYSL